MPAAVSGGKSFTSISARAAHACALQSTGSAWCWGACCCRLFWRFHVWRGLGFSHPWLQTTVVIGPLLRVPPAWASWGCRCVGGASVVCRRYPRSLGLMPFAMECGLLGISHSLFDCPPLSHRLRGHWTAWIRRDKRLTSADCRLWRPALFIHLCWGLPHMCPSIHRRRLVLGCVLQLQIKGHTIKAPAPSPLPDDWPLRHCLLLVAQPGMQVVGAMDGLATATQVSHLCQLPSLAACPLHPSLLGVTTPVLSNSTAAPGAGVRAAAANQRPPHHLQCLIIGPCATVSSWLLNLACRWWGQWSAWIRRGK